MWKKIERWNCKLPLSKPLSTMRIVRLFFVSLFIHMIKAMDQDGRSFKMSAYHGWQLQCTNTTCSPYMTITALDIRRCQATCLAQLSCQGACFSYSTLNCQLFANVWNQINNLSTNTDTGIMFVISGTRTPSRKSDYNIFLLKMITCSVNRTNNHVDYVIIIINIIIIIIIIINNNNNNNYNL